MIMSHQGQLQTRVKSFRLQRRWSQRELAQRAGISRAAVSSIESHRLVPSVAAALALATAFECRVEDLFGTAACQAEERIWAWPPNSDACRYWHAQLGDRCFLFPAEETVAGVMAHDGVYQNGTYRLSSDVSPEQTLILAGCEPAAGLLASEFTRCSGFRLLVLYRSSSQALNLLRRGLVHVAGLHLASTANELGNVTAAKSALGAGHTLLKLAEWQEGLAIGPNVSASSVRAVLSSRVRWVGRETGSGARQCQDALLQNRLSPRRMAFSHRGVADAIRCGWADVGVCVRLVCEEAGLQFLEVRDEAYDLCFPTDQQTDPRLRALIRTVRSMHYRRQLFELPGYDCRSSGEVQRIE
jgi:molybdate-binding protein/DNA-binding XRE family transcriptional regulator